ncbi:MAG: D-2-hydroxyglutarate dehydrogenase YdiJ [Myxococcota bacterium]
MIPRLDQLEGVRRLHREFLEALPGAGFGGDVHVDAGTRLVTATDNSVYQILPQAVVYPKATEDVAAVARLAAEERFREVTLSPRGGGTGTNGQSLSEGVIVDLSRHMNQILDVDLEGGRVRVQPGVVLDQLNAHLACHGVFFAPNLSPSNRATLGGMINTDACGKGSRVYGRTSEHVLALETVLLDGTVLESERVDREGLESLKAREDRAGEVHRVVDDVITRRRDLIREVYPKLRRFMTGYNLARVADEEAGTFDLNALLSGSEGTLGLVTEATLKLTPIPTHRRLVVLKYASFDDALGSAQLVVASNPSAIETIDETVLSLAREDVIWHDVGPLLDGDEPMAAVNLVEYEGADPEEVEARVGDLLATMEDAGDAPHRPSGAYVAQDEAEAAALWTLRKKGVGLLGNAPGPRKPVAFVEDTVVPPERLAEYVAEFRAILDAEGLEYGMFGHVDVGCLHVRPALDLKDEEDEALLRRVSDRVADLARSYGGMMWGEHGKGFRSEYNPDVFGEELFAELCRVKKAFDPHNQLNPGKLAVPEGSGGELVSVDGPKRGRWDRQIPAPVRGLPQFALTVNCNGNGACFDWDADEVMCPSFKVTRDRIHSPKGRAGVMREWLRQLAVAGYTPRPGGRRSPLGFFGRLWNGLMRRLGRYDYSHDVYDAMAGCLACKACATRCPIRVDVPRFRADFLDLYHSRYPRPLRDGLVGRLESLLPLMAWAPRLVNLLQDNPLSRWVVRKVVGMVDTPRLAVETARSGLAARGVPTFDAERVARLSEAERARTVVLVQDAFTRFYEPRVMLAVVDLLGELGFRVEVLPYFPSGKGWHVKGFMARFRRRARRNAAVLRQVAGTGLPMVGVEPAVVLVFRDELPLALDDLGEEPPAARVHLLQEFLVAHADRLRERAVARPERLKLLGHCTERTAEAASQDQWREAFAALGLDLEVARAGCCGMSGAYGHEAVHQEESRALFEMGWARHLPEDAEARSRVLATGHSCRHQVDRFRGFTPRHPAEAVLAALRR